MSQHSSSHKLETLLGGVRGPLERGRAAWFKRGQAFLVRLVQHGPDRRFSFFGNDGPRRREHGAKRNVNCGRDADAKTCSSGIVC